MNKFDQNIFCIKSEDLRSVDWKWYWLQTKHLNEYLKLFNSKWLFLRRWDLENDSNYKQIIPSIILITNQNWNKKYFLHKQTKISEKRLQNMYPIFLWWHIEQIDWFVGDPNLIQNATNRELNEEAIIKSKIINKEFKGIIYIEDQNIVNHMHIWLVRIYTLDWENVEMNESKLEKVWFVDKKYLLQIKDKMTYWSQLYLQYL